MGILSSVVIPLVLQQQKQTAAVELEKLKSANALELAKLTNTHKIEQIQSEGVENRASIATKASLDQQAFEQRYVRNVIQGVITGTAGGIAAGAAKGYFSERFKSKNNNNKNTKNGSGPNLPPGSTPGTVATPYGDVSEAEAKRIWDEFHSAPKFNTAPKSVVTMMEEERARRKIAVPVIPGIAAVALPLLVSI